MSRDERLLRQLIRQLVGLRNSPPTIASLLPSWQV
jgi:hypothetical protein